MKEYYECQCSEEILKVETEDDCYVTLGEEFMFSIFQYKKRYGFWHRLRNAGKIILYGEPYGDQVILSEK
ncbi:unnamed protein product, partial [marine sediment metagenome]